MSRSSTMGLSPIVDCQKSAWATRAGLDRFLRLVDAELRHRMADDEPLPNLETVEDDLNKILTGAINTDGASTLDQPSDEILQAVRYAAVTLLGRMRMHDRLAAMRANGPIGAVQPRGGSDSERGPLYGKATLNAPGMYDKFLRSQRGLRTRYS